MESDLQDNELFVQEGQNAGKASVAGMQWWMPKSRLLLVAGFEPASNASPIWKSWVPKNCNGLNASAFAA
tara:strand:- start:1715 stop:1924 length:210 start_codon:yes stop_codon:yes gene_type:complete